MFVYFLRTIKGGRRIKIGKARNPIARMRSLQTGCPWRIYLVGAIKCKDDAHASKIEKALHEYFAPRRKVGEWFGGGDYLITEIWELLNQLDELKDGPVRTYTQQELLIMTEAAG